MDEDRNVVVKITMPKSIADRFLVESKEKFGDCRWVNIIFKDMMYKTLYNIQDPEIKEHITLAKMEIIDSVFKFYIEMKKEMNTK